MKPTRAGKFKDSIVGSFARSYLFTDLSPSTMGFFDLNIPCYESDKQVVDKAARKNNRLKLIVKAMELGYTGVAYNRTVRGVMSESDRCTISLFPLSSVLKLAPALSAAVKLHRDLLGVPSSAPFHQYTRLTVTVDSSSQASALNSGNPILKTYDLVAVRPLNQNAFEHACQTSEVDLIAIDFSEKLPFRLKQSMVKAAIERDVYFEITYSGLILDAQVRRQMISNAKLLVDWTRGKNLIFSSAASSVNELRGPCDVANLALLLGLRVDCAKAALSKNCRSLIAKALRKKNYCKAIKVELVGPEEQASSKESLFSDWLKKWDPISSGEGDLLLDDMARSFSASSKLSKTVKGIDFDSLVDNLPSKGLQVLDFKSSGAGLDPNISKPLCAAEVTKVSNAITKIPLQSESVDDLPKAHQTSLYSSSSQHESYIDGDSMKLLSQTDPPRDFPVVGGILNNTNVEVTEVSNSTTEILLQPECIDDLPKAYQISLNNSLSQHQTCISSNFVKSFSRTDTPEDIVEGIVIHTNNEEKPQNSNGMDVQFGAVGSEMISDAHVILPDCNGDPQTSALDMGVGASCNTVFDAGNPKVYEEIRTFANQDRSNHSDIALDTQNDAVEEVVRNANTKVKEDISHPPYDISLSEYQMESKQVARDDSVFSADILPVVDSYDETTYNDNDPVSTCEPLAEVAMEEGKLIEDPTESSYLALADFSGKHRVKQRVSCQTLVFPLKRLLNPRTFKRKAKKSKLKTKSVTAFLLFGHCSW
ncbi:Ribonuclease P [Bertholletia excelsa]